jgi:hypothetical protein
MVQSLTGRATGPVALVVARGEHGQRVTGARNLPRAFVGARDRDGLDWDGFRDRYYPASRRHHLEAIVAYGDYRGTPHPRSGAEPLPLQDAISVDADSVGEWEDEGGAYREPATVRRER